MILFEGDLGRGDFATSHLPVPVRWCATCMMKGLRLPKVGIFGGHFNLKALSLVLWSWLPMLCIALLQMTSSPRCLKFWKVVWMSMLQVMRTSSWKQWKWSWHWYSGGHLLVFHWIHWDAFIYLRHTLYSCAKQSKFVENQSTRWWVCAA